MRVIDAQALNELFRILRDRGYTVVGPTVRDRAIVYDEVASTADLPRGWRALAVHPLSVPGLDAERCLVELARV